MIPNRFGLSSIDEEAIDRRVSSNSRGFSAYGSQRKAIDRDAYVSMSSSSRDDISEPSYDTPCSRKKGFKTSYSPSPSRVTRPLSHPVEEPGHYERDSAMVQKIHSKIVVLNHHLGHLDELERKMLTGLCGCRKHELSIITHLLEQRKLYRQIVQDTIEQLEASIGHVEHLHHEDKSLYDIDTGHDELVNHELHDNIALNDAINGAPSNYTMNTGAQPAYSSPGFSNPSFHMGMR